MATRRDKMKKICYGCMNELSNMEVTCSKCDYVSKEEDYGLQLKEGTVLKGRYMIGRLLGENEFYTTYIARDLNEKKIVAIREFFPRGDVKRNDERQDVCVIDEKNAESYRFGLSRFVYEAQTMTSYVTDPCIIGVLESFEDNDTAYIVMNFIEGESAIDYLKKNGTITFAHAVTMFDPMLIALQNFHGSGTIHYYIQPDCILINEVERVGLTGFSQSRYEFNLKAKGTPSFLKPAYTAPELYETKDYHGPWCDVYAIGALIAKMVTGNEIPPADQRTLEETLFDNESSLSSEQKEVLNKALKLNVHGRYQNISSFRKDLKDAFRPSGAEAEKILAPRKSIIREKVKEVEIPDEVLEAAAKGMGCDKEFLYHHDRKTILNAAKRTYQKEEKQSASSKKFARVLVGFGVLMLLSYIADILG